MPFEVDVHSSGDVWGWLHQALQNREEETGAGWPGGRKQEASHSHVAQTNSVKLENTLLSLSFKSYEILLWYWAIFCISQCDWLEPKPNDALSTWCWCIALFIITTSA